MIRERGPYAGCASESWLSCGSKLAGSSHSPSSIGTVSSTSAAPLPHASQVTSGDPRWVIRIVAGPEGMRVVRHNAPSAET